MTNMSVSDLEAEKRHRAYRLLKAVLEHKFGESWF